MLKFRTAQTEDLKELQTLFAETISATCVSDYTDEQIKAWISGIKNKKRWISAIHDQFFLIAEKDGLIAGYASLDNKCLIDLLYIHKDFQRQGIAAILLTELELHAKKSGTARLVSDVSITARPFFEKRGFKVEFVRTNLIDNTKIINYRMSKEL